VHKIDKFCNPIFCPKLQEMMHFSGIAVLRYYSLVASTNSPQHRILCDVCLYLHRRNNLTYCIDFLSEDCAGSVFVVDTNIINYSEKIVS